MRTGFKHRKAPTSYKGFLAQPFPNSDEDQCPDVIFFGYVSPHFRACRPVVESRTSVGELGFTLTGGDLFGLPLPSILTFLVDLAVFRTVLRCWALPPSAAGSAPTTAGALERPPPRVPFPLVVAVAGGWGSGGGSGGDVAADVAVRCKRRESSALARASLSQSRQVSGALELPEFWLRW